MNAGRCDSVAAARFVSIKSRGVRDLIVPASPGDDSALINQARPPQAWSHDRGAWDFGLGARGLKPETRGLKVFDRFEDLGDDVLLRDRLEDLPFLEKVGSAATERNTEIRTSGFSRTVHGAAHERDVQVFLEFH